MLQSSRALNSVGEVQFLKCLIFGGSNFEIFEKQDHQLITCPIGKVYMNHQILVYSHHSNTFLHLQKNC